MRAHRKSVLGAVLLLLLAGGCNPGGGGSDSGKASITVGVSGAFAENQIVAEMYAAALENAGYGVERQMNLESREISQPALESGEIDLKPEYLASLLRHVDPDSAPSGNAEEVHAALKTALKAKRIEVLDFSAVNDTNAFVVTKATADRHNLKKVSDLAPVASQLILGGPPECPERPYCLPGLRDTYGVAGFKEFKPLDVGGRLTVEALKGGAIDVALLFSTSSVIQSEGWVVLEDDKNLQAAENIAPIIRAEVLTEEIGELLNAISSALDNETILRLNARVEIEQQDPMDVAKSFLRDEKLLG